MSGTELNAVGFDVNLGCQGHVERANLGGLVKGDADHRARNVWRLLRDLGPNESVAVRVLNGDGQDVTIRSGAGVTVKDAADSLIAQWERETVGTPLEGQVRLRRVPEGIEFEAVETGAERNDIALETRLNRASQRGLVD